MDILIGLDHFVRGPAVKRRQQIQHLTGQLQRVQRTVGRDPAGFLAQPDQLHLPGPQIARTSFQDSAATSPAHAR